MLKIPMLKVLLLFERDTAMEGIGTDTRLNPCVVYYLSPSTRTYRLRMPLSEAAVKTKVFSAHFAIAATAD